jgi:hypothetical protein
LIKPAHVLLRHDIVDSGVLRIGLGWLRSAQVGSGQLACSGLLRLAQVQTSKRQYLVSGLVLRKPVPVIPSIETVLTTRFMKILSNLAMCNKDPTEAQRIHTSRRLHLWFSGAAMARTTPSPNVILPWRPPESNCWGDCQGPKFRLILPPDRI